MISQLRAAHPEFGLAVSWTTRGKRPGETDGVEYVFVSEDEFHRAKNEHKFVEHVWSPDRQAWYATPWSEVNRALDAQGTLIFEVDTFGATKIKTDFPEALAIFLAPPRREDLLKRLKGRATDSEEEIARRYAASIEELEIGLNPASVFDEVVINSDANVATREVIAIIGG